MASEGSGTLGGLFVDMHLDDQLLICVTARYMDHDDRIGAASCEKFLPIDHHQRQAALVGMVPADALEGSAR